MDFIGTQNTCPFCGQDLRQYNDDLGPILGAVQTATNIDMKSTKVRVTMAVILFVMVFAGALVILDYYEAHQPEEPEPVIPDGILIELETGGYLDLTGDFASQTITVTPLYEDGLKLRFDLADRFQEGYYKVMWTVQTDYYSFDNTKNPFYLKVTKELPDDTDLCSVTWDNIRVGSFTVMANCYTDEGDLEAVIGYGVYYGTLETSYSWNYGETEYNLDYSMSSDEVRGCLGIDLRERLDAQSISSLRDYVSDSLSIADLNAKLTALYTKTYRYTDVGYADFVLRFVQSCFPTVLDSANYHVADYWAYPAETILWGCGDDEDKAILYCSILRIAGMDTGFLILPDTVMSAVDLDLSESYIREYAKTVRGLYTSYTVADTDSDLGLGVMRQYYDVSDDGRTLYYNGEEIHGRYGLEPI